jgi:hypothetical protein
MAFDDDPPRKLSRRVTARARRLPGKGYRQNGAEDAADAQEALERQESAAWCEGKEEDAPTPRGSTVDEDDDL